MSLGPGTEEDALNMTRDTHLASDDHVSSANAGA
jgi:hypothetical protein